MDDVRALLEGNDKMKREAVMDGVSETSTVRYVLDSLLPGKTLGKNVIAAKSSPQVISYVADHDNAVGFIGVSWIGDQEDSHGPGLSEKGEGSSNSMRPLYRHAFCLSISG